MHLHNRHSYSRIFYHIILDSPKALLTNHERTFPPTDSRSDVGTSMCLNTRLMKHWGPGVRDPEPKSMESVIPTINWHSYEPSLHIRSNLWVCRAKLRMRYECMLLIMTLAHSPARVTGSDARVYGTRCLTRRHFLNNNNKASVRIFKNRTHVLKSRSIIS